LSPAAGEARTAPRLSELAALVEQIVAAVGRLRQSPTAGVRRINL